VIGDGLDDVEGAEEVRRKECVTCGDTVYREHRTSGVRGTQEVEGGRLLCQDCVKRGYETARDESGRLRVVRWD